MGMPVGALKNLLPYLIIRKKGEHFDGFLPTIGT
jgi:hypothetical protein